MWSTLEKLKDNITQIASDVLDTQEELDNESVDGLEGNHSIIGRPSRHSDPDNKFETVLLTEPVNHKSNNDQLQTDLEAASMKYVALLKEKEAEVSRLREENRVLKEQIVIITARQVALSNDETNKELKSQLVEKEQAILLVKEVQKETGGDCQRLEEQFKDEKAVVVKLDTQLQKTLEDLDANFNKLEMLKTARQEVWKESQQSLPPFPMSEGNNWNCANEDLVACNDVREEALHKLGEEAEQVMSLSQKLRATEEVCLLHKAEFENKLEEVSMERDKALQNLGRLRKNLLDMEASTTEKMDHDSFLIADLESRLQISESCAAQLQQALAQALEDLAEASKCNTSRSHHAFGEIDILKQSLESCIVALESKDVELSNLQSALGQYYAESDAQERLEWELHAAKEANARLTKDLKVANGTIDLKIQEVNSALKKLASAELLKQALEQSISNLENDVLRLRHALEQSITSLNRMSSDSDFYVDRRIVIKLLVTYIQRHHSSEVLDLMVRMLGFSEDDKRGAGLAQQNAIGGLVRSVFKLPSRFVGGNLTSAVSDMSPPSSSAGNQSFADVWIDFLLEKSKERERREREEEDGKAASPHPTSLKAIVTQLTSSPLGGHHRPSSNCVFPSSFVQEPNKAHATSNLQYIATEGSSDDTEN